MNDGEALLRAIIGEPEADFPRLVYADWLEEQGEDARADFIRVQVELATAPRNMHGNCSYCGVTGNEHRDGCRTGRLRRREPPLDPAGPDVLVEPDVRVGRYFLRARAGWAIRHPLDVLVAERFAVLGTAGRHDVRAQGGGLCGQGVGEEDADEVKAAADAALWAEVRADLAAREARRAKREEVAA